MEPEVFMPATLIGHVAKYCNHVVNSPDENNIVVVYMVDNNHIHSSIWTCLG